MHKAIIENLYYGEERTHVFVARRLLSLYIDTFYETLSAEFFYTLHNELMRNFKLTRNEIEWII